eukprot:764431-Hanusia_phi.AAC.5
MEIRRLKKLKLAKSPPHNADMLTQTPSQSELARQTDIPENQPAACYLSARPTTGSCQRHSMGCVGGASTKGPTGAAPSCSSQPFPADIFFEQGNVSLLLVFPRLCSSSPLLEARLLLRFQCADRPQPSCCARTWCRLADGRRVLGGSEDLYLNLEEG